MKKYLNLVRQITWSFHRTTRIDWEELFGEACLAYCEALQSYQPEKSRESTWIFTCIETRLINFCKMERQHKNPVGIEDWCSINSSTPSYEFFEEQFSIFLSDDVQWIIRMVLRTQERYISNGVRTVGKIRRDLRKKRKWNYDRIDKAMKDLKSELNIGIPVKQIRQRLKWTQEQMSKCVGITTQQVRNIEAGRSFPRRSTQELIVKKLGRVDWNRTWSEGHLNEKDRVCII